MSVGRGRGFQQATDMETRCVIAFTPSDKDCARGIRSYSACLIETRPD